MQVSRPGRGDPHSQVSELPQGWPNRHVAARREQGQRFVEVGVFHRRRPSPLGPGELQSATPVSQEASPTAKRRQFPSCENTFALSAGASPSRKTRHQFPNRL